MKRGTFIFDGVNSETINAYIQDRPLLEAPLRKVEWKSPYGIDGDVPFDEGAYANTNLDLIMMTAGNNLIGDRQKFYNLVDSRGVYKSFTPYFDPDKVYRVMLSDKVSFENKYHFGQKQSISIKFTVKPYKYLINSPSVVWAGTSRTVVNPTNYVSQPIIKIVGNGAVTVEINGVEFKISNVQGDIILDSERYIAYRESANGVLTNMNDRILTREYPILRPGNNTIEVTGSVTQVTIEPRWRSLV